jgi:hypothetical protein
VEDSRCGAGVPPAVARAFRRCSQDRLRPRPGAGRSRQSGRDARTTHSGFRTSCLLTNQDHRLQLLGAAGVGHFVAWWGRLRVRGADRVGNTSAADLPGA